jgi:hypothetical protein
MNTNTQHHFLPLALAACVVLLAIAVWMGYSYNRTSGMPALGKTPSTIALPPGAPRSVTGSITAVSGNTITVKGIEAGKDGTHDVQVIVTDSTSIFKQTQRDSAEFKKESDAFVKAMASFKPSASSTPPIPPTPFVQTKLALSDLSVGMHVSAVSAPNDSGTQLHAVSILIQPDVAPAPAIVVPQNPTQAQ